MTLRLMRYGFVVVLAVATLTTFANAGVLQLVPASEVGNSKDGAAWISEDGTTDECFSGNGAVFSDEEAADVVESEDGVGEMVCTALPPESAASTPSYDQPGDVNGDGYVNDQDVEIIAANWQRGVNGAADATRSMGDLNGDGMVDGSDVTILACHWRAEPIPVPEPSTVLLLVSGIVGLVLARRYRDA